MTRRPRHPMAPDVNAALEKSSLRAAYDARPPYQRNDYLAWIDGARQGDTRRRRIEQMLDELKKGGVYMGMSHAPSRKNP